MNAPRARFGERLAAAVDHRKSQVALGLDPDPNALLVGAAAAVGRTPSERASRAVVAHCQAIIEAVGPCCAAIKLQLACFERLGPFGWQALHEVVDFARASGLITIADGKRGDVPVTASAYADALLAGIDTPYGPIEGLGVDAFTVNPLPGLDSIETFVDAARRARAGVFVLVRMSNAGASDLQDRRLQDRRVHGVPVHMLLADWVARLGAQRSDDGPADVGAVVGAVDTTHLEALRSAMPNAPFLVPGVGAQGGAIDRLGAVFSVGPAGGLIPVSRGIVDAHKRLGGDPLEAARIEAERLRRETWDLSSRIAEGSLEA